jgi:hypothetical protein
MMRHPKSLAKDQRYYPGDEIHVGDRVRCAGDTGTIVFVIDRSEYSTDYPESDWSDYGTGFMIETPAFARVMLDEADEHLELLSRATPTR